MTDEQNPLYASYLGCGQISGSLKVSDSRENDVFSRKTKISEIKSLTVLQLKIRQLSNTTLYYNSFGPVIVHLIIIVVFNLARQAIFQNMPKSLFQWTYIGLQLKFSGKTTDKDPVFLQQFPLNPENVLDYFSNR